MSVFRVALPGNEVQRARINEIVLDNRYPNPKIDATANPAHAGIISLNWQSSLVIASGTTRLIYSFPHNYGYVPTVFASYKWDNGSTILRGALPFQYGALGIITIDADKTNINLKYYSTDPAATAIPAFLMQVRFYVMAEPGM